MVRSRPIPSTTLLLSALISSNWPSTASSLLLSDLPTPSFIIDVQALRRIAGPPISSSRSGNGERSADESTSLSLPFIRLPSNGLVLHPLNIVDGKLQPIHDEFNHGSTVEITFPVEEGEPAIGYLHSSVVRAREDAIPGEDDPTSTFLAEIDLEPSLCGKESSYVPTEQTDGIECPSSPIPMAAKLVLGLNNHHVGSYYWARSAGAGSSMEAPGVWFGDGSNSRGLLRWMDEGGPTACNSNDGKRSEWVSFLRKGDNVQLVPMDGQDSLLQFSKRFRKDSGKSSSSSIRVFGISSEGRPMGSEPEVVCEWRCYTLAQAVVNK